MASKSKRRRRVLGASCILAALIVGASSFAWFTSKDEVTNRLSANADYGVSIVESFAPPKNWVPGQTVEKDVYATNTGSIGAFVEEDVSGILTVEVEKKLVGSATPDTTNIAQFVELKSEERYATEAGAYLAFKPTGDLANAPGDKVVIRTTDAGQYTGLTDFTPNATGLYVFRRSIAVDANGAETFEYQGYYHKDGKYYKVHIDSVTPDTTPDIANDGEHADGNLDGVSYGFYQIVKETKSPVDLTYDATNNRLVATYDTGNSSSADAALAAAAAAYDKALEDYQLALQEQAKATTENGTASGDLSTKAAALATARQNLINAQNALTTAATAKAAAEATYNSANATKTSLESAVTASKTALFGASGTMANPTAGSLLKDYQDKKSASDAMASTSAATQLATDVGTWLATSPTGVDAAHTNLASLTYAELMLFDGTNSLTYDYYTKLAATKLAERDLEAELQNLYGKGVADLVTINETDDSTYAADSLWGRLKAAETALTDATTALGDATDAASNATGASAWAKYNYAKNALGDSTDAASDAADASAWAKYNKALADYNTAAGADTTAGGNLDAANKRVSSANAALTAARKAYEKAEIDAANAGTSQLKININLSDAVTTTGGTAGKWQLLPTDLSTSKTAKFYYTSILGGGLTSSKLIDSVELDDSVTQDMYKSFDFDLNIALKSAQILYADDNETILATAANGDGTNAGQLDADATLATPTDINTAINWTARP